MNTKIDYYVPVIDPSPIRGFIKEFLYYGDRRYEVISPRDVHPAIMREKKIEQPFSKTMVKVALLFTVVIPLIAAIYLAYQYATCQKNFVLETPKPEPEPPKPKPVEKDIFKEILDASLAKSRTQMRMQDSIHAFFGDFKQQLKALPANDQIKILFELPSRCAEIEKLWGEKDGAHYKKPTKGFFEPEPILKDCFDECFKNGIVDHTKMAELITKVYDEKTCALMMTLHYFMNINYFDLMKIATHESYEFLKKFSKEEIEGHELFPTVKAKLEELAARDFMQVFDLVEITSFAIEYNPIAQLFGLEELKIENHIANDGALAEELQADELEAQLNQNALLAL